MRKGELDRQPVVAKLPPRVIPGGIPSAALMAFIVVSKFADHLPLYSLVPRNVVTTPQRAKARITKILGQRYKVPLRRQRICDWIGYVVDNVFASLECRHFVPR